MVDWITPRKGMAFVIIYSAYIFTTQSTIHPISYLIIVGLPTLYALNFLLGIINKLLDKLNDRLYDYDESID